MKLHTLFALFIVALAAALVALVHGPIAAALTFGVGGYMLTPWSAVTGRLCFTLTLTPTQILLLSLQAFRKRVPALGMMGTDFTGMNLVLNQSAIARIPVLPTASTYDNTAGGFKNGAAAARGLWMDVPLTINQWPTVPLRIKYQDLIQDATKLDYNANVADGGFVLGKTIVDNVLGQVSSKNFSQGSIWQVSDCDVDMLVGVGEAMNGKTESSERYMLVSSAVASVLAADQRLINSQWFGEKQGEEPIRVFRNAFGFKEIREYPDMPSNNGTALTGVAGADSGDLFTKAAHGLITGQRIYATGFSAGFSAGYYYVIYTSSSTFQLASSRANAFLGTAVAVTADGTGGVVTPTENMNFFAFEKRAFAIKAGAPGAMPAEMCAALGIPQNTLIDAMFDEATQTAMAIAKWQEPGTADLYVVPNVLFGSKVGGDVTSTSGSTAGAGLDYAGHIGHSA